MALSCYTFCVLTRAAVQPHDVNQNVQHGLTIYKTAATFNTSTLT